MKEFKWDKPKSLAQVKKELDEVCCIPGCGKFLTQMLGPGSGVLCRDHQINQREYGGMGRIDRPHTFHRDWVCEDCGYNSLEDPRIKDIEDEMVKRRIARVLMHGDHHDERKADGGEDTKENIRSLCYVCHAKKTIINEDYKNKK